MRRPSRRGQPGRDVKVWVLSHLATDDEAGEAAGEVADGAADEATFERLGDARRAADRLGTGVGVVAAGVGASGARQLISGGADRVCHIQRDPGLRMLLAATSATLAEYEARLVFASGDCRGREWSARLAVRLGWRLVSPALMVEVLEDGGAEVTGLDAGGRLARKVRIGPGDAAVVTMRPGVGEAQTRDASRNGETAALEVGELSPDAPWTTREELIAADPATVDIRFANRLVAGGRGVGGERGFERLRRFASRIGASVAASRMAVDLGWVERERQVGQTGRTVAPDLYVACGISGASHHLAGMSESDRIVAINSDPQAPIFKVAHLGLITDLHDLLAGVEEAVAGG